MFCQSFFDSFAVSEARGFAGGIWVLWNAGQYDIELIGTDDQALHLVVQGNGRFRWLLTVIYASPQPQHRALLWQYLSQLGQGLEIPWLHIGDFNQALTTADKKGGRKLDGHKVQRFHQMIDDCALIDMGFHGPRFTWSNMRKGVGQIQVRLDRSFCNVRWQHLFPDTIVMHLPLTSSDHLPICVRPTSGVTRTHPKPFKMLEA